MDTTTTMIGPHPRHSRSRSSPRLFGESDGYGSGSSGSSSIVMRSVLLRHFDGSGQVATALPSSSVTTCDENVDDYADIQEDLTIVCLGVSSEPIADFLDTCRELYDKKRETYITTFGNSGGHWSQKLSKIPRPLSSVHLVESVKEELVDDIRSYLDVRTQRRYHVRNIPYRRGYLFYGPPGTGKTTLSEAVAGVFQLNIYAIDLTSVMGDKDLARLFQGLPQRCIVLLEDIDVAGLVRDKDIKVIATPDPALRDTSAHLQPIQAPWHGCTLSGVLQALDSVGSQEGRIIIMTTNRPEDLDDALIRPGRVDKKVRLGRADRNCARDMFIRMFEPNIAASSSHNLDAPPTCCDLCPTLDMPKIRALADSFARQVPEDMFSPGQLQGFFQMHLECPWRAIAQIAGWIEQEKRPQSDEEEATLSICVVRNNSGGGCGGAAREGDTWYRLKPKETLEALFRDLERRVLLERGGVVLRPEIRCGSRTGRHGCTAAILPKA
ncbi:mitochondrial chaperone BCS1 [Apiospora rasikravindrae]|uniref:Mitochondrial chaperone BCS1 n=1 Tax=Apiospora rasikravindrae TaxID=990691 RepID=A0ABR1U0B7_9PEZI